jgi:hypothetical protein
MFGVINFRVRFNFSFSHFVVELPLHKSMSSIVTMDTSMHNGKEGQNLSPFDVVILISLATNDQIVCALIKKICFLAFVLHFFISSFLSLCSKSWKLFC